MKRRRLAAGLVISIVMIAGGTWGYLSQRGANAAPNQAPKQSAPANRQRANDSQPSRNGFNQQKYSLVDPSSIWVIVNKLRPLTPASFVPNDLIDVDAVRRSNISADERRLRSEAAVALKQLFAAASADGVRLQLQSGYRSYQFQVNLYNRYVQQQGQKPADLESARAGHSEHQTGLAADVGGFTSPACNVEACFADTLEGKWVATHAAEHGFVIRYPADETATTGYTYEPWHLRYVGTELAQEVQRTQAATLEAFFNLEKAPDYR